MQICVCGAVYLGPYSWKWRDVYIYMMGEW